MDNSEDVEIVIDVEDTDLLDDLLSGAMPIEPDRPSSERATLQPQ